jgi:CheY-like chemotaxis protein
MKAPKRFIIVDDDPINNMICTEVIKHGLGYVDTTAFEIPVQGLEYIEREYSNEEAIIPTVLLLDINMPIISGWQFLERFNNFKQHMKDSITIYILSPSISEKDIEQAETNSLVNGYLQKPFSSHSLSLILEAIEK